MNMANAMSRAHIGVVHRLPLPSVNADHPAHLEDHRRGLVRTCFRGVQRCFLHRTRRHCAWSADKSRRNLREHQRKHRIQRASIERWFVDHGIYRRVHRRHRHENRQQPDQPSARDRTNKWHQLQLLRARDQRIGYWQRISQCLGDACATIFPQLIRPDDEPTLPSKIDHGL